MQINIKFLKFFFFKQKTAYDISSRDWSSDVCSSDLASDGEHTRSDAATVPEPGGAPQRRHGRAGAPGGVRRAGRAGAGALADLGDRAAGGGAARVDPRALSGAGSRRSATVHDPRDEHPRPLL